MEVLYGKLYDKYNKLKKKKLSEIDDISKEQEEKFLTFVSAAEELVQHLKSEKENLLSVVENLRSEIASIRSAENEECAVYQSSLMEEKQKNKALSEEVERLKEMLQEAHYSNSKDGTNSTGGKDAPDSARVTTTIEHTDRKRKRNRESEAEAEAEEESISCYVSNKDTTIPECCRSNLHASGDGTKEIGSPTCIFQAISQYILGMKLSAHNQVEGTYITVLHQSSGFSFNLTWVNNSANEEPELIYQALSLGTFERVAPEWMRDVLMFSTRMCHIFFQRVSHVLNLHV